MRDVHRLDPVSASPGRGVVLAAWERFVKGEDHVPGVRPEVAISWHRCREQYRVDPHLTEAPIAVAEIDHAPEHEVVFTELGLVYENAGRFDEATQAYASALALAPDDVTALHRAGVEDATAASDVDQPAANALIADSLGRT